MKPIAKSIAIRKVVVCLGAVLLTFASARAAHAQTQPPPPPPPSYGGGIGVGASVFLSGLAGVQVDYDTALWDLEGVFAFSDREPPNGGMSRTELEAGVRGWYHVHHGSSSDFSLGGGVGFLNASGAGGPSVTTTLIEPGARARVFVTPNVAVHAILGLTIEVGDNGAGANGGTGVALEAQSLFTAGFTYYFH